MRRRRRGSRRTRRRRRTAWEAAAGCLARWNSSR